MNDPIGTFILDFQSTDFEKDVQLANAVLSELQKACELDNQYALDPPGESAGWSFAKMFISGQFVERLYAGHGYEIDRTKGRKFNDKFINWLAGELKKKGCEAQVKGASEMKDF